MTKSQKKEDLESIELARNLLKDVFVGAPKRPREVDEGDAWRKKRAREGAWKEPHNQQSQRTFDSHRSFEQKPREVDGGDAWRERRERERERDHGGGEGRNPQHFGSHRLEPRPHEGDRRDAWGKKREREGERERDHGGEEGRNPQHFGSHRLEPRPHEGDRRDAWGKKREREEERERDHGGGEGRNPQHFGSHRLEPRPHEGDRRDAWGKKREREEERERDHSKRLTYTSPDSQRRSGPALVKNLRGFGTLSYNILTKNYVLVVNSHDRNNPWFKISHSLNKRIPSTDLNKYFEKEVGQIINLDPIKIKNLHQVSTILNRADCSSDGTFPHLVKIIDGWKENNKLDAILSRVVELVGTYHPNENPRDISLIFNALAKIGKGAEIKSLYEKLNSPLNCPTKLNKITEGANDKDVSRILGALAKINDDGASRRDFNNRIEKRPLKKIIPNVKVQDGGANILVTLAKIDDGGESLRDFYKKIKEGPLSKIITNVKVEDGANILCALAKSDDSGVIVADFCNLIIANCNLTEFKIIIGALSKSEEGYKNLENICKSSIFSKKLDGFFSDPDSDPTAIKSVKTSLSKIPAFERFLKDFKFSNHGEEKPSTSLSKAHVKSAEVSL